MGGDADAGVLVWGSGMMAMLGPLPQAPKHPLSTTLTVDNARSFANWRICLEPCRRHVLLVQMRISYEEHVVLGCIESMSTMDGRNPCNVRGLVQMIVSKWKYHCIYKG